MNVSRITFLFLLSGIVLLAHAQKEIAYNLKKKAVYHNENVETVFVNQPNVPRSVIGENYYKLDGAVSCGNWLKVNDDQSAFQIGDLDVTGHTITVEALFNRIYINPLFKDSSIHGKGEVVSKHTDPTNANYILRADRAQVTTTTGHYVAAADCELPLNKTYHIALVYDGIDLKYYRNGFLLASTPCTGDLITNDLQTLVGNFAYNPGEYNDGLKGYINEVRIWNVARTQKDIKTYMNSSLPNPTTQNGLLAYYTFDNLKNKQGNSQWDGHLLNNAQINQTNPTCSSFVADSCNKVVTPVIVNASFSAPDTVCVNTKIQLTNTSTNATNNYWSFCATDLNTTTPEAVNIGNLNNSISWPVFMDLIHEGNNYYGFLVDHFPGSLIRLDFGSSFLNTPKTTNLGNFNDIIPPKYGAEGIQMVKNNGKWYGIIVGGSVLNNEVPRIIKIDFGTDITNNSPTATNWGNIGNLSMPTDLYIFYESGNWYGFTANSEGNTITRFNFGNNFDQAPTADNLGGFNGIFNYPVGLYPINDDGNWHLFVTNAYGSTLTRLDFGNSLLNTATAKDLGTLGNVLNSPRDFSIMKSCNSMIGYAVNGSPDVQELVKLDFHNNVLSTPTATSLGNNGNYSFPHSISKLFRVGNDLYSFITNVYNNTITRLKFSGCNSASISNFEGANPPQISYSVPGTYNILLSVDEGLPTQTTYCKQIVVLNKPQHQPNKDTAFCEGTSLRLVRSYANVTYQWNTGSTDSSITVTAPGKYWVQFNKGFDCSATDTFVVKGSSNLSVDLGTDTGLCAKQSLVLDAGNPGNNYLWQDGSTNKTFIAKQAGQYFVKVTSLANCSLSDTIQVKSYASPVVSLSNKATICNGDSVKLSITSQGENYNYLWRKSATLSDTTIASPLAFPKDTTQYSVTVISHEGCTTLDSVLVSVIPKPSIITIADTAICKNTSIILQSSAENTNNIKWSPASGLDDSQSQSPTATPTISTTYIVVAANGVCQVNDTVSVTIDSPLIDAGKDTTLCGQTSLQLQASGGVQYQWIPEIGLSDADISNPVVNLTDSVTYSVTGTDQLGCSNTDSIRIKYSPSPVFSISKSDTTICKGDSVSVTASGGNMYSWEPVETILQPLQDSVRMIPDLTTIYTVTITNTVCSLTDKKQFTVSVLPSPAPAIVKSNDIDCARDSALLTASGGILYNWLPATGLTSTNTAATIAMPDKNIIYTVKVTDENGCMASDTIQLTVKKGGDNKYGIPNAFTPNGDGINDCFGMRSWKYIKLFDLAIFNRWGVLLFHTNNISDCWNGMYKSNYQPNGAYVYQVHAETDCGIVDKKGTFVLIR